MCTFSILQQNEAIANASQNGHITFHSVEFRIEGVVAVEGYASTSKKEFSGKVRHTCRLDCKVLPKQSRLTKFDPSAEDNIIIRNNLQYSRVYSRE